MNIDNIWKKLIQTVLLGEMSENRTATDAISIFSYYCRIDISETLACITLKKIYTKSVIAELIWFMKGSTNTLELNRLGSKIWDANTNPEVMKSLNLDYEPGEAGPIYGAQWRHRNDQLRSVIHDLRHNPNSRRIIINSWNPMDIPKMALPPCHFCVQFSVKKGILSAQLSQRSADVFLGVPFNYLSYSILVHFLAKICGLTPGFLAITFGDAHIYSNHIDLAISMLPRKTKSIPTIEFSDKIKSMADMDIDTALNTIDELMPADFKIIGYDSYPAAGGRMAV